MGQTFMNILQYFWKPGSRKVALGIVLFLVANAYFVKRWFSVEDLMTCIFLSTALVGGGTIADSFFASKNRAVPKPEEKKPE